MNNIAVRSIEVVEKANQIKSAISQDMEYLINKQSLVKEFIEQGLEGLLQDFSLEFFDDMINFCKCCLEIVDNQMEDVEGYTDEAVLEKNFFHFEYFTGRNRNEYRYENLVWGPKFHAFPNLQKWMENQENE